MLMKTRSNMCGYFLEETSTLNNEGKVSAEGNNGSLWLGKNLRHTCIHRVQVRSANYYLFIFVPWFPVYWYCQLIQKLKEKEFKSKTTAPSYSTTPFLINVRQETTFISFLTQNTLHVVCVPWFWR